MPVAQGVQPADVSAVLIVLRSAPIVGKTAGGDDLPARKATWSAGGGAWVIALPPAAGSYPARVTHINKQSRGDGSSRCPCALSTRSAVVRGRGERPGVAQERRAGQVPPARRLNWEVRQRAR
jgi:hypothetical protein